MYWTELEGFLLESYEAWHLERAFEETCVSPPYSTKALLYTFESSQNGSVCILAFYFVTEGLWGQMPEPLSRTLNFWSRAGSFNSVRMSVCQNKTFLLRSVVDIINLGFGQVW